MHSKETRTVRIKDSEMSENKRNSKTNIQKMTTTNNLNVLDKQTDTAGARKIDFSHDQRIFSLSCENLNPKCANNEKTPTGHLLNKGNLMNASDPRIFEMINQTAEPKLPVKCLSDIEECKLIPQTSDTSTRKTLPNNKTPDSSMPNCSTEHSLAQGQMESTAEPFHIDKQLTSKSNKYMLMRTIGRGNFAKVKLAKHMTTDRLVAIKIIDKTKLNSKILSKICREVILMKQLNHPNIVQLLEVMENESTLYLVLEYASGGELFDYLVVHGCMKEKEARIKFRQMVSAVHYCHSKSIVHRDLKAENMLLNNRMEIKIVDFGFANIFNANSKLNTFCGSPPYAAPELFLGHKYVGPEVDVWSLGVILFTLVSGRLPFDANTLKELKENVLNLRYEFPYFISQDCENLLRKMLVVNPKERASLSTIMEDTWINGGNLPKLMAFQEPVEKIINEKKVNKLKLMGYEYEEIKSSITEKKFNAIYATYILMSYKENHDSKTKRSDDNSKRSQNLMSDKNNKVETDSISEIEKSRRESNVYSLTKVSGTKMAKSIKNWFQKNTEIPPSEDTESFSSVFPNKELYKQMKLLQSLDPNTSLPKGANQQALVETLNQMSWNKGAKAAMFQHEILGQSSHHKGIDKTQITAAPFLMQLEPLSKKSLQDGQRVSKFLVQNVKTNQPSTSSKLNVADSEIIESDSHKKGNILKIINNQFSKKQKNTDDNDNDNDNDSDKTKVSKSQMPSFIGKYDFSQFTKSHKHKQNESEDIFSIKHKPRVERFAFSMSTTSSKDPDEMMNEIIRVLKENDFHYDYVEKYLLLCWNTNAENDNYTDSVQWEMEICRIPLLFMHGIRMKRIFGSTFAYKSVASQITKSMKL